MKKIIAIIATFFVFAITGIAQDTVQYLDPYYLFNERHPYVVFPNSEWGVWSTWDDLCSRPGHMDSYDIGSGVLSRYHTSNNLEPIMIYGIAHTVTGGASVPEIPESEISNYPYVYIIATINGNTLNIIDSIRWNKEHDCKTCFKYSIIGDGQLYEHVVPAFEYYFETPVLVYDTFYVGYRRTAGTNIPYAFATLTSYDSMSSYWVATDNINNYNHREYAWGGVFPIIQPNRHCRVPAAPSLVVYSGTNTVRFTLPYAAGDSLVLSIAGYGQPADSGTVYPVTDSIMDIVIPDSGRYTARLMRICQRYGGVMLQSDWSGPTHFFIVNNLAIGQPSDIGVSIVPNPATDAVTVSADGTLLALELRDLLGRTVLTQQPASTKTTLDVSTLPAGTYILRLHTPQGVATKKLIVK